MDMNDVKIIVESRDMVYKGQFLEQLSKEEFNNGMRKVNLQKITELNSLRGEGCWAWVAKEDRIKYDGYSKEVIKVILANSPIDYMGILFWGSELLVKCNGYNRPTLSVEWVNEKILNSNWFKNQMEKE